MASSNNLRNAFFDRLQVNDLQITKNLTVNENAEVDLNGENWDYIVVGCGIAGLWGARKLAINNPDKSILIIASGERINQETFYNNYAPDRGIDLSTSNPEINPDPGIDGIVMYVKSNPDNKVSEQFEPSYSPMGGNTLINGCIFTSDPKDFVGYEKELQEMIDYVNPVQVSPANESNIPDGPEKEWFKKYSNFIYANVLDERTEPLHDSLWINPDKFLTGTRYDPYLFILDENGNKFENIHVLENTYVHNLILDSNGRCLGTRNLSTPNSFGSISRLNNTGKLLLSAGYLGTTTILNNLKQTIPRNLSSQLEDIGLNFQQNPSSFFISIIPNIKPEWIRPNKYVFNGTSFRDTEFKLGFGQLLLLITYTELSFIFNIAQIPLSDFTKEEFDPDKPFLAFVSIVNPGVYYNQYFDNTQNGFTFKNKGNELTKLSVKNGFALDILAPIEPSLKDPNNFNVTSQYTYYKWKDDAPESIKNELFDALINTVRKLKNLHIQFVNEASEPGATNELFLNGDFLALPPTVQLITDELLNDRQRMIDEILTNRLNNNYHLSSGNTRFIDETTNRLNISENVFIGDQSVWEDPRFRGAAPASTGVCSMLMANKAAKNMSH
jgi:hypothetical protein